MQQQTNLNSSESSKEKDIFDISYEEWSNTYVLKPIVQGLFCGAAHLLTFHLLKKVFIDEK